MKKYLSFVFVLLFSATLFAQDGIQFNHGNWSEVLAAAKKENKLIFIDAYTTWCGPCKWMAKNTFTDKAVGEYFNANFVNAKFDMEKGEGLELAKKYKVRAYPTLLFVNGDGELIHQGVGGKNAEGFIALGKEANDPAKQIMPMVKRFEEGDRDPAFLKNFAKTAQDAYLPNAKEIGTAYLKTQDDLMTEENMKMVFTNTTSKADPYFNMMVENRAKFATLIGADRFNARLQSAIVGPMYRKPDIDFADVEKAYMEVFPKEESAKYTAQFKMNYYRYRLKSPKGKAAFLKAAVAYLDKYEAEASANELNSIAWTFYEATDDMAMLKKACGWAERSVKLDNGYYNNDTVAAICHNLGKKGRAKKYAKRAIALGKKDNEDVSSTEELLKKIMAM